MPLFKCSKCGCIDNTALGNYWMAAKGEATCSECHTGTWHGRFPKLQHDEAGITLQPDGFYAINR